MRRCVRVVPGDASLSELDGGAFFMALFTRTKEADPSAPRAAAPGGVGGSKRKHAVGDAPEVPTETPTAAPGEAEGKLRVGVKVVVCCNGFVATVVGTGIGKYEGKMKVKCVARAVARFGYGPTAGREVHGEVRRYVVDGSTYHVEPSEVPRRRSTSATFKSHVHARTQAHLDARACRASGPHSCRCEARRAHGIPRRVRPTRVSGRCAG
jgi:hypothetical protein